MHDMISFFHVIEIIHTSRGNSGGGDTSLYFVWRVQTR